MYCLDDGTALLEGPTSTDEPATKVLPVSPTSSEAATTILETPAAAPGKKFLVLGALGVIVAALIVLGAYRYYSPVHQVESIAVMPFVNAAANPDLDYLSDGITESLINSLSQIPNVSVKARSSVFTYKGKEVTPKQVANDLAVQAVLNGRVVQRGDLVILNVELVDASSGNQIWGDQYTRKVTDLVQLQSEIARDVSGKLRSKLTGEQQQKIAKNYTQNTEAYQLYLQGRYYWNKRKPDDIRRSIEYFQQAIDRDPTYALAYAGLAEAYIVAPQYNMGPASEYYPKARVAAARAIELDDTLAEGHSALATVLTNYDWKFAEAETEYRRALELNPNYASAHQWYAEHLYQTGRLREGLAEMQRAQELDPLSPIINALLGVVLRYNGRLDDSFAQLKKTVDLDPNFPRPHLFLAEGYEKLGRYDDAVDEFAKAFTLNGGSPDRIAEFTTRVKTAARSGGDKAYSRAMAETMEKLLPSAPTSVPVAGYWARAGETDKAFQILEQAYQNHDATLLMLTTGRLASVASDPRYKDLVHRVGLPE